MPRTFQINIQYNETIPDTDTRTIEQLEKYMLASWRSQLANCSVNIKDLTTKEAN